MFDDNLTENLQKIYATACETPFTAQIVNPAVRHLDREQIEQILPHQKPMLMLERVSIMDTKHQLLVGYCDPNHIKHLADHYHPTQSIFPPGFQIEAMGQAGALYLLMLKNMSWRSSGSAFTHICHADFHRSIIADHSDIQLQARIFEEDLFDVIIGQCIWQNNICSTVVLKGISAQ